MKVKCYSCDITEFDDLECDLDLIWDLCPDCYRAMRQHEMDVVVDPNDHEGPWAT